MDPGGEADPFFLEAEFGRYLGSGVREGNVDFRLREAHVLRQKGVVCSHKWWG